MLLIHSTFDIGFEFSQALLDVGYINAGIGQAKVEVFFTFQGAAEMQP